MARLYGREFSRAQLEERVGELDQLGGLKIFDAAAGPGRGARHVQVSTGNGFACIAVADRALDVASASFEGVSLVWHSGSGVLSAGLCGDEEGGFLRWFFGGLFTTCGLTNFGPGGSDAWGSFGLHGRIDAAPAEDLVCERRWEGDECVLEVRGTVVQKQLFGEHFVLERRLRTRLGARSLEVHDVVTNRGERRHPHMLLYHCNGGFPLLDERSEMLVSHSSVRPRDAQAQKGLAEWDRGAPPSPGFAEQVFVHEVRACSDGRAAVALCNPELRDGKGLALAIRFDPAQLPALFTWRMLGRGTYVMGMEPANCPTIEGRVAAGERGTLPFLEPGESRHYDLEFCVLTEQAEIESLRRLVG